MYSNVEDFVCIWLQRRRDATTEFIYKLENGMVELSVNFYFPLYSGTAALAFEVLLSKEEGYLNLSGCPSWWSGRAQDLKGPVYPKRIFELSLQVCKKKEDK